MISDSIWFLRSVILVQSMNLFVWIFACCLGEKKLSKVIVPDKWKDGARNVTEGGGRKINENKLLSKKNRFPSFL